MNLNYHKSDFAWDCNVCSGIIRLEDGRVDQAIKDLGECLQIKKDKLNSSPICDAIATIDVPDDLGTTLAKAMNDLQNATTFNALFIMNISFLEFALTEICRLTSIYLKTNYYTYPTKDRGLDKSKTFLKETLGIDISAKKNWSDFKVNASVRNCLAHNNANIVIDYDKNLENQPNYEAFKANKNFNISETGFLHIATMDYIKQIQADESTFIKEVFFEVKEALTNKGIK